MSSIIRVVLVGAILAISHHALAQIGGERSFEFLNLPTNARVAGLGGVSVSNPDRDVNLFLSNPSLLDSAYSGVVYANYLGFVADIGYSSVVYAHRIKKAGLFGFGFQYLNHGEFDSFDPSGASIGTFRSGEYAFTVGYNHTIGPFTMGTNMKIAVSDIATFSASALLFDIGGTFRHPRQDFTVGLVLKNIGFFFSDYREGADSKLPFDVQLGTTFKPRYMPLRFSLTAYNLYRGNIAYYDPDSNVSGANEEPGTFDKIARHFTFGMEVLISKNFHLRGGYNHLIRKELRLVERSGGAGFSFGFMARIKKFEFAYSRSIYHLAGGGNYFTLGVDLNSLYKKKQNNE